MLHRTEARKKKQKQALVPAAVTNRTLYAAALPLPALLPTPSIDRPTDRQTDSRTLEVSILLAALLCCAVIQPQTLCLITHLPRSLPPPNCDCQLHAPRFGSQYLVEHLEAAIIISFRRKRASIKRAQRPKRCPQSNLSSKSLQIVRLHRWRTPRPAPPRLLRAQTPPSPLKALRNTADPQYQLKLDRRRQLVLYLRDPLQHYRRH